MSGERSFVCKTCDTDEMDVKQMKAHLTETHGIVELKGTQTMISHLDGQDWYSFRYKWQFDGDVVVIESMTASRDEIDPQGGEA